MYVSIAQYVLMALIQRVRCSAGREGCKQGNGRTTASAKTIKGVKEGCGGEKNVLACED